ncbi:hypothetical protein GCM10019016_069280 [Streptomyces prasinosporus]|uniref:Uncharacterized protein n=1 Tax=Streptomyces prasinosporus TaxID=68256 RepID=A0ABP6TX89_9ACTN
MPEAPGSCGVRNGDGRPVRDARMADVVTYDAPSPVTALFPRSLMDVREDGVVSSGEARRNPRHKSGGGGRSAGFLGGGGLARTLLLAGSRAGPPFLHTARGACGVPVFKWW